MKPCPFCKGTDTSDCHEEWVHPNDLDEFYVLCDRCDARGPAICRWGRGHRSSPTESDFERFKEEARSAWNDQGDHDD